MARYAITIFLSAFLLFQVQPLIGKFILPWFGGSPAVWTTCMLFFQVFLLGGYAYAHFVASRFSPRAVTISHWALLALSLVFLPIAPNADAWKGSADEAPIAQILALLAATIGLPYLLLSSTGPLLQEGFRRESGHPPYRLYALSNVGSLLALLSYPFVFEPQVTLHTQIIGWSWGYALFVPLCAWCVLGFLRSASLPSLAIEDAAVTGAMASGAAEGYAAEEYAAAVPDWRDVLLWLALAACGSVMLLATTNQMCQEVAAVPFLWVVPLALYLTTFIICFDHERWYHRTTFLVLLTAAILGASYALAQGTSLQLWKQIALYSAAMWVCCMVCHGELVRAKPAGRFATLFYLMVAAGGAIGGVLVAIVAPTVLPDFWEYQFGLFATVFLAFVATYRGVKTTSVKPLPVWIAGGGLTMAIGLAIGWIVTMQNSMGGVNVTNLETTRNFYGVLRVNHSDNFGDENGPKTELINGRIEHGFQYEFDDARYQPTTYFGPPSGVGIAILNHPRRIGAASATASGAETGGANHEAPAKGENNEENNGDKAAAADKPGEDTKSGDSTLNIGIIGLGCGTIAAYGKPGDHIRFYEINPKVIRIANEYFTYCKDSQADVEFVLGDARVKLEQELAAGHPQDFDILVVDAFSSDMIPMHLLTKECAEVYRKHLKPDGLLCLHLSNRFLKLEGVARALAEVLDCECVRIDSDRDLSRGLEITTWVILTKNKAFLETPAVRDAITPWNEDDPQPLLWTDDYGSLWPILKN